MRNYLQACLLTSLIALTACNTIEHRSEAIAKVPLSPVQNKISAQLLWKNNTGKGIGRFGSRLNLSLSHNNFIAADNQGQVYAINQKNGAVVWRTALKQVITAGPLAYGHLAYVGLHNAKLTALNTSTGVQAWQAPLTSEMFATPMSHEGTVYVHTLDGGLTALSEQDGRQLWRYSLNTPTLLLRSGSRPVIYKDHVITAFANGKVVAMQRMDGTVAWEQELAKPKGRSDIQRMVDLSADPILAGDMLYVVGFKGPLAAIDAQDGNIQWKANVQSVAGLEVDAKNIYVSDAAGVVQAVKRDNGENVWQQPALTGRRLTKPLLYKNIIFVGDEEGYLHGLAASDGHLLARFKIDGSGLEAPLFMQQDILYISANNGNIYAYQIQSGK